MRTGEGDGHGGGRGGRFGFGGADRQNRDGARGAGQGKQNLSDRHSVSSSVPGLAFSSVMNKTV